MDDKELQSIKEMALSYGDPIRGKMLALVATVEKLNVELGVYKKHANDFEEMYKQEHSEKNAIRRNAVM